MYSITENEEMQMTVSKQDLTCHSANGSPDGIIDVGVSGGTSPYTYMWSTSDGCGIGGNVNILSDLCAGTYIIVVMDGENCSKMTEVILDQPDSISISTTALEANCDTGTNGTLTFTAMGGTPPYSYAMLDTNTTGIFTDLLGGVYVADIFDANGCMTSESAEIFTIGGIMIDSLVTTPISCNGFADGSIQINIANTSSTFTYTLDGVSNQTGLFENLDEGSYSVLIEDANGCQTQANTDIDEPDLLTINIDSTGKDDGSMNAYISISNSGGTQPYAYSINGGSTFQDNGLFDGLAKGVYTIISMDANGCSTDIEISILSTNLDDIEKPLSGINIFPVPTQGAITIQFTQPFQEDIKLTLFNTHGQVLNGNEPPHIIGNESILLDLSSYQSGVYLLKIEVGSKSLVRRVVVCK